VGQVTSKQLTTEAENSFVSRARYPKGKKSLQAILDATYDIIVSEGLGAASQDAIAKRAKVTQSAVRHYFPTKEGLLIAFFSTGVDRLRVVLDKKMAEETSDPSSKLLDIVSTHYDAINDVEDVYYFESAAFWGRNPEFRRMREKWYQKMARHYGELIQQIHPDWSRKQCEDGSFQVMTLILGGWFTMGNNRPFQRRRSKNNLKAILLAGIEKLIN
jgi:AcrR family transcriptional regulator